MNTYKFYCNYTLGMYSNIYNLMIFTTSAWREAVVPALRQRAVEKGLSTAQVLLDILYKPHGNVGGYVKSAGHNIRDKNVQWELSVDAKTYGELCKDHFDINQLRHRQGKQPLTRNQFFLKIIAAGLGLKQLDKSIFINDYDRKKRKSHISNKLYHQPQTIDIPNRTYHRHL
jgi:hypothetical protein